MSYVIDVNGVSKRFRNTVALDNVSLQVPKGVVFALLGENGAGKTTLIRCLLGLDSPDKGTVSVMGTNPRTKGVKIRREVGYVSDTPALYEWMTVHEIGWFASGFYPPPFYVEYAKRIEEFDLDLHQKIKHLSKGGRAKVSLALAMAHQPQLLILDEPTSGLDTLVRRHFLESMIDVAAEGRTILLSSHQIPEIERVADWVAIVNHGQLVACDSLDNLKSRFERWVVTFESAQVPFSPQGATIVHREGAGKRRQQFVVRDCAPETLWEIREQIGVVDVEVHPPTLEEVFVALMKSSAPSSTEPNSNETAPEQASGINIISATDNTGESR